ncbi:riboflavin synthase [Desulfosporosinus sp. BICA1-9]|uniref:riboflavin synthase n=1 Tax=Desulfosporosinus sp. BICA1-9 TaxID=1531958 RepID=UPI00054B81DF|nr:riboflavin synthase [Desulfosporosinus sp. BICA1-9]KJS48138.1 MAG: riboflavin synthase subunit alpha [Peptococcaceae bacterium BRH_c23]KJS78396.1 MAG: riboflavin synthase subunit alpha [Desulfosporosinus sp. BICA1-9]HBW36562.1 riboflavin synthase [Desulfosporosinus sp.]
MFTGIVEELGTVRGLRLLPESGQLTLEAKKVLMGTQIGDSISVNGVCLTVIRQSDREFTVDVMAETLAKTNLAELKGGSQVNLERALQLQTRLGGHLVSGHVDGVGTIRRISPVGIALVYEINAPPTLLPFLLPKGSVAIDGISLTVIDVESDYFTVSLIPHTFDQTTLGLKTIGASVNLETDLIGKYVARFMGMSKDSDKMKKDLSLGFLAEHGFI